jgi:hypothetical protein
MQYKAEAVIGFRFSSQHSSQHTRKYKEILYKSIKLAEPAPFRGGWNASAKRKEQKTKKY